MGSRDWRPSEEQDWEREATNARYRRWTAQMSDWGRWSLVALLVVLVVVAVAK